jgi:succinyl-diaminopimelate desuccinylase
MQARKTNPEDISTNEIITLAQALIRLPSENPPADYGPISTFIYEILSQSDAEVVIMEGQEGKPNIAALMRGEDPDGPTLLLDGHMDVVPAGDPTLWDVDPYAAVERNGEIWGRGSLDMKGSLASQIQAFLTIARSKERLQGNLIFAASCDDETGGKMGMGYVFPTGFDIHGWPHPTFHLLGEPNQLNVTTAFKGRIWLEVEAHGKRAHGGTPHNGVNAIEPIVAISRALPSIISGEHPLLGHDTFNFGTVHGGVQVNVVPDQCVACFDMRFGPHLTTQEVEESVHQILEAVSTDASLTYNIFERREPLIVDPEIPAITLLCDCVAAETGRHPEIQGTLSAGDLIYSANHGIPGAWVGPGDPAFFHVINERISTEELVQAARIYKRFARLYLGTAKRGA